MLDFICQWCGKDVMKLENHGEDFHAITLHGPHSETIELCNSCYMTALQALQFGKEVTLDCLEHGNGRRIYVAVEAVGKQNELVNALIWPNTELMGSVKSARKSSITYRAYPD